MYFKYSNIGSGVLRILSILGVRCSSMPDPINKQILELKWVC